MTMMTRRKVLGASTMGLLGGLAGCLDDSDDSGSGNGGEGSQEIEVWANANQYAHLEAVGETFNEESDHTVNTVDGGQLDSLSEEVLLALNSQENLPGATVVRSRFLQNAARLGGVAQLNDLMEDHVDNLFPAARTKHRVDGNWYSTPNEIGPTLLFYNQTVFEEAGLPTNPDDVASELETWSDFQDAAETLDEESDVSIMAAKPGGAESTVPEIMTSMMGGVGPFYNEDGEFQFDKPGNVRAMEVLQNLLPYSENTYMFQGDGSFWGGYQDKEIATIPYPAWARSFLPSNLEDQSGEWRITQMPYHPDDPQQRRSGNLGGEPIIIPAAVDQSTKDVAKEFVEMWNLSEVGFNAKLEAGVCPANDVEDADALEEEDEFFGGQQANRAMIESARAGGPARYAPSDRCAELFGEATREILSDGQPIEDTLADYHDQMLETIDEADQQIELP